MSQTSPKILVANWKSHLNSAEIEKWVAEVASQMELREDLQLIIAPSFVYLPILSKITNHLALCAQSLSPFPNGAYTGAVSAQQISEFAKYALLGHAERRKYFDETDVIVGNQAIQALENNLTPIIAVDDHNWRSQLGQFSAEQLEKCYVMYEPPSAISTNQNGTVLNHAAAVPDVLKAVKAITAQHTLLGVLYGGSVDSRNVAEFMSQSEIAGCVIGNASLDPQEMLKIWRAV